MSIFKSRKFWLAIADVIVSGVTYFLTRYGSPEAAKDILYVIGLLQPVIISVIIGIAYEDGQEKRGTIYQELDEIE